MIDGLQELRDDAEWHRTTRESISAPGTKVSGRRVFRDCTNGCDAYAAQSLGGSPEMLRNACAACTLKARPDEEVMAVLTLAALPDSALDMRAMPFWLVNAIGYHRASLRGGF